jgi:hypothetical protein
MIQRNNNLSVLPFYENPHELSNERTYAYGEVYPLYTPLGSVPPFQILMPHGSETIANVYLRKYGEEESEATDIEQAMTDSGLRIARYTSYDIVIYPSVAPAGITTEEGRQQVIIELSGGGKLYSDWFTVVADMSAFLQIQWWDIADLVMDGTRIVYVGGFKNTLWLNTQLGKPEYEFEEEGETRDGYFYPEKMISEKKYKCVILAPEYLCDVMRFIRMSDYVIVKDRWGHNYRCDTFLCTPKWETQGDLASVEIEFTCETVAKKVGRGYIAENLGDFNDDFNDDFDITDNN